MILVNHDVSMEKELDLTACGDIVYLILRRLVMNRLVKIVHAENCKSHFFSVFDVLLCHEVLVCEEFVLVFIACLV